MLPVELRYRVSGEKGVYTELNIKHVIRCSLKGEAAHVLKCLGSTATVHQILQKFDLVYGTVEDGEDTLAEAYFNKREVGMYPLGVTD